VRALRSWLLLAWCVLALTGLPARAASKADLTIAIARSGVFQVGSTVSYAVTVTNLGPGAETGMLTVGGSIPAGLTVTGVSGAGWTCTASSTLGTCSYSAGLARGASTPALTVTVYVATEGEKTVTATVTGSNDGTAGNNTASNTGKTPSKDPPPPPAPASYAFTNKACTPKVKIGADANACQLYSAGTTAGRAAEIWVTALDAAKQAMAPAATVTMQFALRCVNPAASAGVSARIGSASLPACAPAGEAPLAAGRWSGNVDLAFAAGQASKALSFVYADVGQVELQLRQGGTAVASAPFVSAPWKLEIRNISRGGVAAPAAVGPTGQAFAMAGESLLVEIGARVEDASAVVWAKNFGNEATLPALGLDNERLYTVPGTSYLRAAGVVSVDAASWKRAGGTVSVNAAWSESGATRFVLKLADYLGSAGPWEAAKDAGRFVPAYFTTEITAPLPCAQGIACPARPSDPVGMAYSGQPFKARVLARGLQGQELLNYTGAWFRTVDLTAVFPAGTTAAGTLSPATLGAIGEFDLTYTLPNPYAAASPTAKNWTAPTAFFLRAHAADGLGAKGITSDRAPAASDEDGLVVLSGRLRVPNALGTDVLRTALALRVEYWSGAAWVHHAGYADLLGVPATLATFTDCTRTLAGVGAACDPLLVGVSTPQTIALDKGAAVLWLRPPGKQSGSPAVQGKRRDGSVVVQFPAWSWLPSTKGRVTYGLHRSPLIYARELY